MCIRSSDGERLPCRNGDDAVQRDGQQLLAAGGGSVSAQPAGHHRLLREELLLHLPLHRLGCVRHEHAIIHNYILSEALLSVSVFLIIEVRSAQN